MDETRFYTATIDGREWSANIKYSFRAKKYWCWLERREANGHMYPRDDIFGDSIPDCCKKMQQKYPADWVRVYD